MDPQPAMPPTPTSPVTPVAPTPTKSKLPMILVSLVVLLLVGGGGIFLGRQLAKPVPTPSPMVEVQTEAPNPPDPTADWKPMTFSPTITFRIPPSTTDIRYVNTGHYAQETVLPNGTYLQIWGADGASPTGGKDDYDLQKHLLTSSANYDLNDNIIDGHEALNFSPSKDKSKLIYGGKVSTETDGVLVKMNDGRALVVIHYQTNDPSDASKFMGDWENDVTIFNQILSTFKFTNQNTNSQPSATPIPGKSLSYGIASGWVTVQDKADTFEVAYDPANYSPLNDINSGFISLGNKKHSGSVNVSLKNYNGGSRHQFIYDQLGYSSSDVSQNSGSNTYDTNYSMSGRSCLIISGLSYSASGVVWGMCVMSPTQAIFFSGLDTELENEKFMQSFKLLK